eukprot:3265161-Rhodomonas_salina.4
MLLSRQRGLRVLRCQWLCRGLCLKRGGSGGVLRGVRVLMPVHTPLSQERRGWLDKGCEGSRVAVWQRPVAEPEMWRGTVIALCASCVCVWPGPCPLSWSACSWFDPDGVSLIELAPSIFSRCFDSNLSSSELALTTQGESIKILELNEPRCARASLFDQPPSSQQCQQVGSSSTCLRFFNVLSFKVSLLLRAYFFAAAMPAATTLGLPAPASDSEAVSSLEAASSNSEVARGSGAATVRRPVPPAPLLTAQQRSIPSTYQRRNEHDHEIQAECSNQTRVHALSPSPRQLASKFTC